MIWTPEAIVQLLNCQTDEEMLAAFPGSKLSTLQRRQREFRRYDVPVLELDPVEENRKDREIGRLKEEIVHLRKLYKSQTKDTSALDAFIEAIYETVPSLAPVAVPPPVEPRSKRSTEELVLLLSDLHIGEWVDPEQTANLATFNIDIARRRVQHTVDAAIDIAKNHLPNYHFTRLNVFMLGDLVSGIIHDELRVNDERGIVEQCIIAVEILAEALRKLAQEFPEVHVASVVGNHGRVTEEKYFKAKAVNNYDYLVSMMLQRLLEPQKNITWNIPKSFWTIENVQGSKFLLMHGDIIKSWMGIPWYGLSRAYMKWRTLQQDYGLDFHHLLVGHYHNPNVMSIVRYKLIVNGCIKGGDEYSIGAIAAACDPVQIMFGVSAKRGITHIWELNSASVQ